MDNFIVTVWPSLKFSTSSSSQSSRRRTLLTFRGYQDNLSLLWHSSISPLRVWRNSSNGSTCIKLLAWSNSLIMCWMSSHRSYQHVWHPYTGSPWTLGNSMMTDAMPRSRRPSRNITDMRLWITDPSPEQVHAARYCSIFRVVTWENTLTITIFYPPFQHGFSRGHSCET